MNTRDMRNEIDWRRKVGATEETTLCGIATTHMTIEGVRLVGDVRNVVLTLGKETVRPSVDAIFTPPYRLRHGEPLAIEFDGDGGVVLLGYRTTGRST